MSDHQKLNSHGKQMISKVLEEAMENMVRRIEVLEDKLTRISIPNKQGFHEKKPMTGTSTDGQLGYIKKLGGKADSSMSKQEASNEIDRLLQKQRDGEPEEELSVDEPKEVDTDEAGIDSEGLI